MEKIVVYSAIVILEIILLISAAKEIRRSKRVLGDKKFAELPAGAIALLTIFLILSVVAMSILLGMEIITYVG